VVTMREVAAAAGVSAKTVSRVFNSDPQVHPDTRERVERSIRDLGYMPNALATTFRSGRSSVIGIAVPDISDPFFASLVRSVQETVLERDMPTLVTSLGDDPARERAILESMLGRQLSGLVVAPITADQSHLTAWASRTPLVFVDRAPGGLAADSFTQEDVEGARLATRHLLGHGHTRIAFLGDTEALPTTGARLRGYREALAEAGIGDAGGLHALGITTRAEAEAALERLRQLDRPPTAVFSSNARCTMALLPTLSGTPFSLVAFGDFPLADLVHPSITVVAQDPVELGRLAATRILDRIAHPGRRFRRRTVLPVRLIERASCRSAPLSPRG
jgi:LacI family transcriptional regulator